MRVHKGSDWTTFGFAQGCHAFTMYLRRVFHPVRGEEVQIQVTLEHTKDGKRAKDHAAVRRKQTMKGDANMTPAEVEQFATVLLGRFRPAPKENTIGSALNQTLNVYQPVEYADKMSEREARMVKVAFLDGYDYRESLIPEKEK